MPYKEKQKKKEYDKKYLEKWRKDNPKKCYQHSRKWLKKHPEKSYQYTKKYRANHPKIGKLKLRFLILQEANFTCQYCGRKAPEVELQIDHKYPKSKGGKDKISNYIVACKGCNLGKGDIILKEFVGF